MANEFNIKNGFISKGNSSVEGSLSANTIFIQSITSGTSVGSLSIDSTGKIISGSTGANGTSGSSGTSGVDGSSGTSGVNGSSGTSGTSGIDGTSGTSGISGTSGVDGSSGTSGINGSSGTSGINGSSGTSGVSGTSGIDGTSGTSGVNGLSGTSGIDGTSGSSGTSGFGTSGTSGINGSSGTSGVSGSTGRFGIADSGGTYTYYSALTEAMSAATSGQTIEMFTDYTETGNVTITLKDGVNINGNGHFYTLNNSGTTNALQISSTGTYQVYNLTVQRVGSSTANGTQNLPIYCNSNDVTCFFTGSVFIGNGYGGSFNNLLNAVRITDGTFISFTAIGLLVYGNYSSVPNFAEVRNVQGISQSLSAVGNSGAGLYLVGANAYNCSGRGSAGAGIYMDTVNLSSSYGFSASHSGLLSGPAVQINQCYGQSYGRYGIEEGEIKNSAGYSTANIGLRSSGYIFNSVGKSTANVGLFAFGNAANCSGISSVSSGFSIYDGNTTADNCTSISTASVALLTASGIAPTTTYNNCVFNCKWNNASGHATSIQSNNVEFNNCTFVVTNSSANCLHAAAGYTVKYASNVFKGATTPVNANITQGIINTQDNYGNILI